MQEQHPAPNAAPRPRIAWDQARLVDIAQRWKVTRLELFGSVLRDDFRPDSDVDVLVVFAPDATWRFYDLLDMKDEPEAIFGRRVDLIEKRLVKSSPNYIRRRHILAHAERVYAA